MLARAPDEQLLWPTHMPLRTLAKFRVPVEQALQTAPFRMKIASLVHRYFVDVVPTRWLMNPGPRICADADHSLFLACSSSRSTLCVPSAAASQTARVQIVRPSRSASSHCCANALATVDTAAQPHTARRLSRCIHRRARWTGLVGDIATCVVALNTPARTVVRICRHCRPDMRKSEQMDLPFRATESFGVSSEHLLPVDLMAYLDEPKP